MSSIIFFLAFSGAFITKDVNEYLGIDCALRENKSPRSAPMRVCGKSSEE